MFNVYIFCIPYSVCQQGPSIKGSLSYQTQRSYHSKSMELIWKKKPSHKVKTAFRWSEFKLLGNKFSNISFLDVFFWICTIFFSIRFVFLGTFYTNPGPHQTLGGCASLLLPGHILMQQLLTIFPAPVFISYTK